MSLVLIFQSFPQFSSTFYRRVQVIETIRKGIFDVTQAKIFSFLTDKSLPCQIFIWELSCFTRRVIRNCRQVRIKDVVKFQHN
ncbi:hypothetical protein HanXRQr2_Chr16g0724911 [Helianthus annuus]|uniref:Uncharacterized protein n=1 Tax=Helianthus annuus TaxID=4232 RepID=A0A9K3DPX6_HELAN|nr:hypothetical protein HanXRQr2_Chr16g0724911 [Helianthus annuus]